MKEFYTAPEAEIIHFAAEEAVANNELQVSFVGFDVTEKQDGDWNGWNQWFN